MNTMKSKLKVSTDLIISFLPIFSFKTILYYYTVQVLGMTHIVNSRILSSTFIVHSEYFIIQKQYVHHSSGLAGNSTLVCLCYN